MRLIIKSIIAIFGLILVAGGAAVVALFGVGGFLMFKQAKLADGGKQQAWPNQTPREPVAYEPMSLDEIRAL